MNPLLLLLASMVRHVVVTGLFALVALLKMPDSVRDLVEDTGDFVAPVIVSLLAWVVVKYWRELATKIGFIQCVLFATSIAIFGATSCSHVDANVDTRGAIVRQPDGDGDGIPDIITVPSSQVSPVVSEEAVQQLNEQIRQQIVNASK